MLSPVIIFELIAFGNNLPKFNTNNSFGIQFGTSPIFGYAEMKLNESLTFEVDSKRKHSFKIH